MTGPTDDPFVRLQREYLDELPALLEDMRRRVADFRAGRDGAAAALHLQFHRLAGSGGSHGFPAISEVARDAELRFGGDAAGPDPERLDTAIARLTEVVRQAWLEVRPEPVGAGTLPYQPLVHDLRVRVILPPGRDRDQLVEALAITGATVDVAGPREDPVSVPAEERPDMLVIGTAAGEGDPSAIASAWTARREVRPRAVVLIETLRAVDRLRAVAAGVDAVFPGERMVEELPRYVRTMARAGAPPSSILVVDPDGDRAATITRELAQANVPVVRSPLAQPLQELLDREVPDLLVLAPPLADADAVVVSRMVRQDPRFHLLPILFLGPGSPADRVTALQAGADDYIAWPAEPDLLLQTVITRAERGRRIREMLHRDELTGLLNHGTLTAELEYSVEYARRHGGPLAFLVFDLDRFGEVNERFGQLTGDQVLLHVANVFRSSVRASDLIGRYGGEEFAMILRGGNAHGAAVVAAKLRRVLGEQAATTTEGVIIPLQVSVGWAVYPADGSTAGELAHGAMRALRREKAEQR